ncbi:hypothetical protein L6452_09230 [Arctium lappa]|uniref:Uncharacterized protein n=1 Tax=Arctium lappa TaxID=4217 RepID=A0ACB9DJT4_ARCLA|nr:hypothetical protein L6452_09230 [Arctium lappa]
MGETYSMNEIYVKDVVGSSSGFHAEEDSTVDGLTGASPDSNISRRQVERDDCDVDATITDVGNLLTIIVDEFGLADFFNHP